MKKTILLSLLISLSFYGQVSATWVNKTMTIGGLTRSYRVYQSPNYNATTPASLLIALHGLGDNMTNFSGIGFNYIADTANIICIFPQAVSDPFVGAAWNSGAGQFGYYPNSTVDDIGFINAMIDTTKANYAIDHSRVYLCGFSMGGFMTEKMALQSNNRIAAFASMSGTFGSQITTFNPGRHVPIAHFHGTSDSTVYYSGNLYGKDADSLISFWVLNNGCNPTPTIYSYTDAVADSITVDRFEYSNGDPQSDVWFFKMYGAAHTVLYKPANDINEAIELWLFLSRHTFLTAGINSTADAPSTVQIFPNPAKDIISIKCEASEISANTFAAIYNIQGQMLLKQPVYNENSEINLEGLAKGIYVLKLNSLGKTSTSRIVKE